MGYIKKKEGNVLIPKALFNGHWRTQETEMPQAVGSDNIAFLPYHNKNSPRKEVWLGHGAAASVLMIFCGLFVVQNMRETGEEGRALASDPLLAVEEENSEDDLIIADLNSGRRGLSSVNEVSLEQKEYFEHTVLNSYYVSFSADNVLSEVQLRPDKPPIHIKDHREFIQKNREFFPKYSQIQEVREFFSAEENLKTYVYRMTNSSSVVLMSFQTDEQGMLISILVENEE